MAGWHHRLDGHEFEQTLGVGDGKGGLVCCGSWGHKESDTTERLNWTEHYTAYIHIHTYILFIHSSISGRLGCFHFVALVHSAANEHACTKISRPGFWLLWVYTILNILYTIRGGLLSPAVILYVTVKNYSPVFHGGCKEPFCIPTIRAQEFQFLHILTSTYFLFVCLFVCIQFNSATQSCPTLCDPMDCSTPGFSVHHQLPEFAQTHEHQVSDPIQPSHPLSSPSPPAFSLPQHQGLFQWVSFLHPVTKVLECQLQHQNFQWIFRTDFHLNACVVCTGLYLSPFCKWGKLRQRETKEPAQGYILIM